MNARESLAADRDAEAAWAHIPSQAFGANEPVQVLALIAIAAELRAARIYANYLEGRKDARSSDKRFIYAANDAQPEEFRS